MKFAVVVSVLVLSVQTWGGTYKGVTLPDEVTIDGKKKVLNGMALRTAEKYMMRFKIYVAGLYLDAKSSDEAAILNSTSPRQIIMEYKRAIKRGDILQGWKDSKASCIVECEKWDEHFKEFEKYITKTKKRMRFTMTFYPDRLHIDIGEKKGDIASGAFAKNILNVFISEKNKKNKKFRKELLGIAKK